MESFPSGGTGVVSPPLLAACFVFGQVLLRTCILGTVFPQSSQFKKGNSSVSTGYFYSGLGLLVDTVPAGAGVINRYFYIMTLTK